MAKKGIIRRRPDGGGAAKTDKRGHLKPNVKKSDLKKPKK